MSANPYDQFGAAASTEPVAAPSGNPYDQFTPPAKSAPAKPKPQESPYSLKNQAGAAVEPTMSFLTGAVAAPISGLAGIAGALLPGPPGQGANWVERTGQALTYQPKTAGGQTALHALSSPFEQWARGSDWAGGNMAQMTGSPAAGAGTNALLQLLPQLFGARGAGRFAQMDRAPVPKPPPEVQLLADKGVTMTPGQIKGGLAKRVEEKVGSIPILGDAVREAKVKGVEDFNVAGINDALKPIGEKLPDGLKGNKAIEWAQDKLSEKYDAILPKLQLTIPKAPEAPARNFWLQPHEPGVPPPPAGSFPARLQEIKAGANLPELQRNELGRIIDNEILKRADKDGLIDGAALKKIESKLTGLSKTMGRSENYDIRELGYRVRDLREAMREEVTKANPKYAAELKKINEGYGKFKVAQKAASSTAAREGVFTPTQYHGAVKAKDTSKDKAAFARGEAQQQQLSTAGKKVLPDQLGDSGTADRLMLAEMLRKPWMLPPAWIASLLYSRPALQGMQSMMLRPPQLGQRAFQAMPIGAEQQGNVPTPPQ